MAASRAVRIGNLIIPVNGIIQNGETDAKKLAALHALKDFKEIGAELKQQQSLSEDEKRELAHLKRIFCAEIEPGTTIFHVVARQADDKLYELLEHYMTFGLTADEHKAALLKSPLKETNELLIDAVQRKYKAEQEKQIRDNAAMTMEKIDASPASSPTRDETPDETVVASKSKRKATKRQPPIEGAAPTYVTDKDYYTALKNELCLSQGVDKLSTGQVLAIQKKLEEMRLDVDKHNTVLNISLIEGDFAVADRLISIALNPEKLLGAVNLEGKTFFHLLAARTDISKIAEYPALNKLLQYILPEYKDTKFKRILDIVDNSGQTARSIMSRNFQGLTAEIERLNQEITKLVSKVAEHDEVSALRDSKEETQREAVKKLEEDYATLQKENESNAARVSTLTTEKEGLVTGKAEVEKRKTELENQNVSQQAQITTLTTEISRLQAQVNALQDQLSTREAEKKSLERRNAAQDECNAQDAQKIAVLQAENEKLKNSNAALRLTLPQLLVEKLCMDMALLSADVEAIAPVYGNFQQIRIKVASDYASAKEEALRGNVVLKDYLVDRYASELEKYKLVDEPKLGVLAEGLGAENADKAEIQIKEALANAVSLVQKKMALNRVCDQYAKALLEKIIALDSLGNIDHKALSTGIINGTFLYGNPAVAVWVDKYKTLHAMRLRLENKNLTVTKQVASFYAGFNSVRETLTKDNTHAATNTFVAQVRSQFAVEENKAIEAKHARHQQQIDDSHSTSMNSIKGVLVIGFALLGGLIGSIVPVVGTAIGAGAGFGLGLAVAGALTLWGPEAVKLPKPELVPEANNNAPQAAIVEQGIAPDPVAPVLRKSTSAGILAFGRDRAASVEGEITPVKDGKPADESGDRDLPKMSIAKDSRSRNCFSGFCNFFRSLTNSAPEAAPDQMQKNQP